MGDRNPGDAMRVNEIFGPTVQGEGPHAGRRCLFLRLTGCNLSCTWCDTPYTWRWRHLKWQDDAPTFDSARETHGMTTGGVLDRLDALGATIGMVVVTGGEPLMQQSALVELLTDARARTRTWHVETNGTRVPGTELAEAVAHWSVSPKMPSAGVGTDGIRPDALAAFLPLPAVLKVVVADDADVAALARLLVSIEWPRDRVWLMPQARTASDLAERLGAVGAWADELGVNVSGRVHVAMWGDRRGV